MARSVGVVAMGGYNTFCEILSFDKPALFLPRTHPRMEQFIRAERARELGIARVLHQDQSCDHYLMATALRHLPQQAPPSAVVVPGLLDGLLNVDKLVARQLARGRRPALRLAAAHQR